MEQQWQEEEGMLKVGCLDQTKLCDWQALQTGNLERSNFVSFQLHLKEMLVKKILGESEHVVLEVQL